MEKLDTIFFDLDGTLYSYNEGHKVGLEAAYKYWKNLTGDSYDQFMKSYSESRRTVKRFLTDTVGSHSRALYFQGMVEHAFNGSLALHIAELTQRYWDAFIEHITPFDGVETTLKKLQKNGYRLAIITNMSAEIQFRKLHKLKLDQYFDAVISSEESGKEKPHPHIYLHAINRLKIQPETAVMVGDDYANDVEAAKFIGLQTILIAIEGNIDLPTPKVHKFKEIVPLLEEMTKEPLDGVIKYHLQHNNIQLELNEKLLDDLISLRDELWTMNLIGVYPAEHPLTPNVGFGNASLRYTTDGQFLVSGTQTGDLENTRVEHYPIVLDYNIDENSLISKGSIKPSSESLTHAAIYAIAPDVIFIAHVHNEKLWKAHERLGLLTTPEHVPYGTPEMAKAIQEVYRFNPVLDKPVCMLGHTDGLIAWGKTVEEVLELFKIIISQL
ncbi:MAG: HAD-IA family hydrolase [Candidatus Heimdallarchaeota archaeon]|nr:HAD-IA family hydrolase [Candidatus Heimdallarchaeota archaeon]